MSKKSYLSREERKDEIFDILSRSSRPLSVYGIAKRLGIARSTHLQNIIMEMVSQGDLDMETAFHRPPAVHKRLFTISKELR